jgi:hypothetical protein
MAAVSMLANVTHFDDSVLGGQETSVYFWGSTRDRSLYLTMELYLESIRQHLESKALPIHLSYLESYTRCFVHSSIIVSIEQQYVN